MLTWRQLSLATQIDHAVIHDNVAHECVRDATKEDDRKYLDGGHRRFSGLAGHTNA
jgi:hypothetical protein